MGWIDKRGVPCLHLTEQNGPPQTFHNIVPSEYLQEAYMSCSAVQVLIGSVLLITA